MNIFAIVGIAVGLSLDAFAVALANATVIRDLHFRHGLRMAAFFGFFQFLMPVIGWAAGITFAAYITGFDHWIAFGLLLFVGGKMIWEGLPFRKGLPFNKGEDDEDCGDGAGKSDCRNLGTLFIMSIATSIDALAVGISFAMIKVSIIVPSLVIGAITFSLSLLAYWVGKFVGGKVKIELEIIGGIVLVGIGTKILLEHLLV